MPLPWGTALGHLAVSGKGVGCPYELKAHPQRVKGVVTDLEAVSAVAFASSSSSSSLAPAPSDAAAGMDGVLPYEIRLLTDGCCSGISCDPWSAQAKNAKTYSHLPPTTAIATMLDHELAIPLSDVPLHCKQKHERQKHVLRSRTSEGGESAGAWEPYLQVRIGQLAGRPVHSLGVLEMIYLKAAWPRGKRADLLPLRELGLEEPVVDGSCAVVRGALLEFMRRRVALGVVEGKGSTLSVQDLTCKVNSAGLGLGGFMKPVKTVANASHFVWRTTDVFYGRGWGPKDNESTWVAI